MFPAILDPWFYAAAIPAVALIGFSKGGFGGLGLLALPLMALVTSPVRAAAILLPLLIVQDVVSVVAYRNSFDKTVLARMMPGAMLGIGVGWAMARTVTEPMVRLGVGVIAVGFVLLYIRRRLRSLPPIQTRPEWPRGTFWGAMAGYTSFVAHAGGPPFQVHVLPMRFAPLIYAGTSTMFFAIVNAVKVLPYTMLGQFSAENLGTAVVLAPVAIASTMGGVWLVQRIAADRFYGVVYTLTFLVGLKLIYDGWVDLH